MHARSRARILQVTPPEAAAVVPFPTRLRALLGTTINDASSVWPYQRPPFLPSSTPSSPRSSTGRLPSFDLAQASSAASLLSVQTLSVMSAFSGVEAPPPPNKDKNGARGVGDASVVVGDECAVPRAQQEGLEPASSRGYSSTISTSSPATAVLAASGSIVTTGAAAFRPMQCRVAPAGPEQPPRQAKPTFTRAPLTNLIALFSPGESPLMIGCHNPNKPGNEEGNNNNDVISRETSSTQPTILPGRGGAGRQRWGGRCRRESPTMAAVRTSSPPSRSRKTTPDMTSTAAVGLATPPLSRSKKPTRPPLVGLLTMIRTNSGDGIEGVVSNKGGDVRSDGWSGPVGGNDHRCISQDGETIRAARGTHDHTEEWTRAVISASFLRRKQSVRSTSPLPTPGAWTPAADGDQSAEVHWRIGGGGGWGGCGSR